MHYVLVVQLLEHRTLAAPSEPRETILELEIVNNKGMFPRNSQLGNVPFASINTACCSVRKLSRWDTRFVLFVFSTCSRGQPGSKQRHLVRIKLLQHQRPYQTCANSPQKTYTRHTHAGSIVEEGALTHAHNEDTPKTKPKRYIHIT